MEGGPVLPVATVCLHWEGCPRQRAPLTCDFKHVLIPFGIFQLCQCHSCQRQLSLGELKSSQCLQVFFCSFPLVPFLFGNCHFKLICDGFRWHEESPLMYGSRFPCTTRSNPGDEAPMTTESSLPHLLSFPFIQCKPFLQSSRGISFPWLFLKAFPIPLICMLNCLLTLLPPMGQVRKPSPIFPKSFSSPSP